MRITQVQQTITLLIVILATMFSTIACDRLSQSERERIQQLADQGSAFAGTVAANAPEYAATAQAAASTAIAVAPTVVVDAQAAAATVSVNAKVLAEQANSTGESLFILADRLTTRVASLQPDANGDVSIVLNEAELSGLVIRDEENSDRRFSDLAVTFEEGLILLTGNVTRPVEAPFAAKFIPYAEEGVLKLAISESSVGAISLPRIIITRAEVRINKSLTTLVGLVPGDVQVTSVAVTPGVMTITANRP